MSARTVLLCLAASLVLPSLASAAEPAAPTRADATADAAGQAAPPPAGPAQARSAALVLGPELEGRFFVYDTDGHLISELFKPAGRTVELGLDAGSYDVVCEREPLRLDASVTLAEQQRRTLDRESFRAVEFVPPPPARPASPPEKEKHDALNLKGRTRVEFFGGFTDDYVVVEDDLHGDDLEVGGGQGGMSFAHWVREDLALDFQFLGTDLDVREHDEGWHESTEASGSMGLLFGARYYFPRATFGGSFRPYVSGAVGPFFDYYVYDGHDHTEVHHTNTSFGGQLGGGVDFQISRLFSLGVKMAVNLREDHDPSFGATFGFGFAWGGPKQ